MKNKKKREIDDILIHYGRKPTIVNRFSFKIAFLFRFFLAKISPFCPIIKWRVVFAKWRGVNIGKDVYIGHNVEFDYMFPSFITIGDHSGIGSGVCISSHHSIPTNSPLAKAYPREVHPVKIGKGVDINLNVIIQPGVSIGDYSLIGNGAVITKDIPPMTLAAGIPAKPIKDLSEKIKPFLSEEEFNKLIEIRKNLFNC